MKILTSLSNADFITITVLAFAWLSIILLLLGIPSWGIYASLIAFVLDLLDGYVARKTNQSSSFGKHLDSHADVFLYLVFSVFIFLVYISDLNWHTVITSSILLICGILRLVRFTDHGIIKQSNKEYYIGLPVYVPYFWCIYSYFSEIFLKVNLDAITEVALIIITYLMISEVKNIKTRNWIILGMIILSIAMLNFYAHK